jgi:hypothetical protein
VETGWSLSEFLLVCNVALYAHLNLQDLFRTPRFGGLVKGLEAALNTERGNMRAELSLGEHRRENINTDYRGNHRVQLGFQLCCGWQATPS